MSVVWTSSLLGSRIAIDHGPRKPRPAPVVSMEPLTVDVEPRTVRTPWAPVGPGPLQSFTVDSRLSAVADSERPSRTRSMTVPTWRKRTTKLVVDTISFYSARVCRPPVGNNIKTIAERSQCKFTMETEQSSSCNWQERRRIVRYSSLYI